MSPMSLIAACLALAAAPADAGAATGAWREVAPMLQPRLGHAAAPLPDGRVLVTGGRSGTAIAALRSVEAFDPATGSWQALNPMLEARLGHSATALTGAPCATPMPPAWCGSILVVGLAARAERYVPSTGQWVDAGVPSPRVLHTAVSLPDGRVLVAGGRDPSAPGQPRVAAAELYDPATGQWSPAGTLATPRDFHAAAALGGGRVLVAGGTAGPANSATDSVEVFDAATVTWSTPPALSVPRFNLAAAPLANGSVLLAGGTDGVNVRSTTERHDGAALAPATPLEVARADHTATALGDGRVLVAGGGVGEVVVGPSEVYSADGSRAQAGSLQTPRGGHVAEALAGSALVVAAGGTVNGTNPIASAELFDPAADPAPGAVSDLTATLSGTTARLTFSAVGTDGRAPPAARRYVVRQSTTPITSDADFDAALPLCGGTCEFGPSGVGQPLSLTVDDLARGTIFYWAMRAEATDGRRGPLSNVASAATPPAPPPAFDGAIDTLSARATGHRTIELAFRAPAPVATTDFLVVQARTPVSDLDAFDRARPLCGGTCRFPGSGPGDHVSLTVEDLLPRTAYHYAVRARAPDGGLGPLSNPASATTERDRVPPGRATRLSVRPVSATAVSLSFEVPRDDGGGGPVVTRFEVRQSGRPIRSDARFRASRRLCSGLCRLRPAAGGRRVTLTVTGLCPARRYHYAVRPVDAAGNRGRRSASRAARTRVARRRCAD